MARRDADQLAATTRRIEHDACGVGFVANIKGERSHDIVEKGLDGPART